MINQSKKKEESDAVGNMHIAYERQMESLMTNEIKYARLGEESFIAGISLEAITADAEKIYPDAKVVLVNRSEIPKEYNWSLRKIDEFPNWQRTGTYLLIRNFETYGDSFKRYFPEEAESRKATE
jgi:hypothetical protein